MYGRSKAIPVPKHHATKTYKWNGGNDLNILKLAIHRNDTQTDLTPVHISYKVGWVPELVCTR